MSSKMSITGRRDIEKINSGMKNKGLGWFGARERKRSKKRKAEQGSQPPRICEACSDRCDRMACIRKRCPFLRAPDGSQIIFK